jgi:hypothetical protein
MQVQIDRCFGFDTAVEEAQRSLISARVEARSSGGISVVKLMGRQSGFIAMNASMASGGCCSSGRLLPGWCVGGWCYSGLLSRHPVTEVGAEKAAEL